MASEAKKDELSLCLSRHAVLADIQVILFDLDDTLWDCKKTLSRATAEFAKQYPDLGKVDYGEV